MKVFEKDTKNMIALSIIGVATLILTIVGATYAWFGTRVEGNGTEVVVETANLGTVKFNDGDAVSLTTAYPGDSVTKTFTVEAPEFEGDPINYVVALNMSEFGLAKASLANDNSLVHSLTCTTSGGGVGASMSEIPVQAVTEDVLAINGVLESEETHTCTYTIRIKETGEDQNFYQGLSLVGKLEISNVENHQFTANGKVVAARVMEADGAATTTDYFSLATAIQNAPAGATIDVIKDSTIDGFELNRDLVLVSSTNATVYFSSASSYTEENRVANITIIDGATLTLGGADGGTLTLKGMYQGKTEQDESRLISVSDGVLNINTGAEIGYNNFSGNGGCVAVYADGAVNMTGGTITNCTAQNGGAIYVTPNGLFEMYGGTITDNKANIGGSVYISSGLFTMKGGVITNSTATDKGGAIFTDGQTSQCVQSGSEQRCGVTLDIEEGFIQNSTANHGGGIYINRYSKANLIAASIANCTAKGTYTTTNGGAAGGAVYANGELYMRNSNILNSHAEGKGGGIYVGAVQASSLEMNSSTISGCSAGPDTDAPLSKVGLGGGLYIAGGCVATLNDSSISDCTSSNNGAGVHIHNTNGQLILNGATDITSAIYAQNTGIFENNSTGTVTSFEQAE